MALVIPIRDIEYESDLEVTILGFPLILRLQWLERRSRWSLDILRSDEVPLVAGMSLLPGVPLPLRYSADLPVGFFWPLRKDGSDTPFSRTELSRECVLFFLGAEDVPPAPEDPDFAGLTVYT